MRGPYFDELAVGQQFTSRRRVVTETDVVLFTNLAGLLSPMFTDREHARAQGFDECLVPGPLVLSYSVGLTEDITHETVIAALAFDELRFERPVHPGQAIWVVSTVDTLKRSSSRPTTGIVRMRHEVWSNAGHQACSYFRTMLYATSDHGASDDDSGPGSGP